MKNRKSKVYACKVCCTQYLTPQYAQECQQRRLIPPIFRVGEQVGTDLKLWCLRCRDPLEIKKIIVVRVAGPFPSDPPILTDCTPELRLDLAWHTQRVHDYRYDIDIYPTTPHSCNSSSPCERVYVVPQYKLKKLRSRTRKPARPLRHKK